MIPDANIRNSLIQNATQQKKNAQMMKPFHY